jgi:ESCRT-II complex subunit VPS36
MSPAHKLLCSKDKNPDFQNGTIHITTHRLLYIDHAKPRKYSLSLSLGLIKQTEYYAGFLKSSPKVILLLTNALDDNASTEAAPTPLESTGSGWICSVCSYSNPPSASGTRPKCVLCGVIQDPSMLPASSFAKSVPSSSSIPTQSQVMLAPQPQSKTAPIPCPTCTFLNHPSMRTCEICGTPLRSTSAPLPIPGRKSMQSLSTDVSPVGTPDPHGRDAESMIKISFRKGGDKTCYASLKRTLLGKAWEGEVRLIAS